MSKLAEIPQDARRKKTAPARQPIGIRLARQPWLATLFIACTATTFALGSTMIRFAYESGANTLAVVTVRATVAALGLGLVLFLRRVPLRLSFRECWVSILLGTLVAGYAAAMYLSMVYMPIALAVLAFYTYPIFTSLFAWLTGQERFSFFGASALALAFGGLLLALDVSQSSFSLTGAFWAIIAALGFSTVLILSAWLFPKVDDTQPRTFLMLLTSSVVCLLAVCVSGTLALPNDLLGWSGLLVSSLCYAVGMTAVLFAAAMLGSARVAVVMNIEPIASLVLTFLILGERLRPVQLVGAAFVIAAIFLVATRRPEPSASTAP